MAKSDKEKYNEAVVAAYRKIMDLAEFDSSDGTYGPEDEEKL